MKKFVFILIFILLINIFIFSTTSDEDYNFAIAGTACYYTGLGLSAVGVPLVYSWTKSHSHPLLAIGLTTWISGFILKGIIGPVFSLVSYTRLNQKGIINVQQNPAFNPGLWYGLSWIGHVMAGLGNFFALVGSNQDAYTWFIPGIILLITGMVISITFRGLCANIPLFYYKF